MWHLASHLQIRWHDWLDLLRNHLVSTGSASSTRGVEVTCRKWNLMKSVPRGEEVVSAWTNLHPLFLAGVWPETQMVCNSPWHEQTALTTANEWMNWKQQVHLYNVWHNDITPFWDYDWCTIQVATAKTLHKTGNMCQDASCVLLELCHGCKAGTLTLKNSCWIAPRIRAGTEMDLNGCFHLLRQCPYDSPCNRRNFSANSCNRKSGVPSSLWVYVVQWG